MHSRLTGWLSSPGLCLNDGLGIGGQSKPAPDSVKSGRTGDDAAPTRSTSDEIPTEPLLDFVESGDIMQNRPAGWLSSPVFAGNLNLPLTTRTAGDFT